MAWSNATATRSTGAASASGSPSGRARVEKALADLLAFEREVLADVGAPDRAAVSSVLRRLLSRFDVP